MTVFKRTRQQYIVIAFIKMTTMSIFSLLYWLYSTFVRNFAASKTAKSILNQYLSLWHFKKKNYSQNDGS